MDARNNDFDFDFTPIGQAIKKARTAKGMTRMSFLVLWIMTQDIFKRLKMRGKSQVCGVVHSACDDVRCIS